MFFENVPWSMLRDSHHCILCFRSLIGNVLREAVSLYQGSYWEPVGDRMMDKKAGDLRSWLCFIYSSSPDLRFSMALCDQEKAFRYQRKENVKENMKKLLGLENSESLCSTRDVSCKFFQMLLQFSNNFVCTSSPIPLWNTAMCCIAEN